MSHMILFGVDLPHSLYSAAAVRALDRFAIDRCGIPGIELMNRAGAAAFAVLQQRWPAARRIVICCGAGNNGGDGYVVARLAHQAGLTAAVIAACPPETLKGDARLAWQAACEAGVTVSVYDSFINKQAVGTLTPALSYVRERGLQTDETGCRVDPAQDPLGGAEVIVDALFGTGLDRPVVGEWAALIMAINAAGKPVLALDIPSGLNADTGAVPGAAVRATTTVSFIGLKPGLFTGEGPACCGTISFADLAVPPQVYADLPPTVQRIDATTLSALLPPRSRTAHKGEHGHVLVIGGDAGMAGAVRLAAEAALRSGAGLVSVATRAGHAAAMAAARPEVMWHGVEDAATLRRLVSRATVVAIGPGLGRDAWGQQCLAAALETRLPLVVDADALNLLATQPQRRDDWVLTPHPGEAARLLATTAAAIQSDRLTAASTLVERYGGVAVLKGAGTIVAMAGQSPSICSAGNPGMAVAGMGDVLTGVIAALVAQGLTLADAARVGVCLHAVAGDRAARAGERGLLAGDLMPWLRRLANPG